MQQHIKNHTVIVVYIVDRYSDVMERTEINVIVIVVDIGMEVLVDLLPLFVVEHIIIA